jgi:hypothetical protein
MERLKDALVFALDLYRASDYTLSRQGAATWTYCRLMVTTAGPWDGRTTCDGAGTDFHCPATADSSPPQRCEVEKRV